MTRIRLEQEVAMFVAEYATLLAIDWNLGRMAEPGTKDAAGSEGQSPKNRLEKLSPRWEHGLFVGVKSTRCE